MEKPGVGDFAAIICNAAWLRENGIDLPEEGKSELKPEVKKKEVAHWRSLAPLILLLEIENILGYKTRYHNKALASNFYLVLPFMMSILTLPLHLNIEFDSEFGPVLTFHVYSATELIFYQ